MRSVGGRLVAVLIVIAPSLPAQQPARDTLTLPELQSLSLAADPRHRQLALQRAILDRRLKNLGAERLPSLTGEGMAQYQSVVTTIPIRLPNVSIPTPPHDVYDARVDARQRLYDPSLAPRGDAERAQTAEAEARVHTAVYALRAEVNDAFFAAALMQSRAAELTTVLADLDAQLRVARSRVREGTALPSEAATLEAELLRRRQDQEELTANRRAALAVLATLSGRAIRVNDTLVLPALGALVAAARGREPRDRPEYELFTRTRERLTAQERVIDAQTRPRLSAFGRAGYGKPGLNFLRDSFEPYWVAGLQVQWTPWTWHATSRERETLALQREVIVAEEEAFTAANRRVVERQLADMARLEAALATDDEIIILRERIERETRRRFEEAVVTASDYVDRRNDVLAARMARVTHEVELAQARARYLTTLGLELR